jgi:hexosaminidase
MVDAGRKYFTPAWFEREITELASLKLNLLHLHLSDNQGFRIESKRHPEIVSKDHLTQDDVRRLVAFAAARQITVVPEIDMPGHLQAALAAHPELQLVDALGVRAPDKLDVSNPDAVRLALDLIDELLPLFPGRYWHGGADEYMPSVQFVQYPRLQAFAQAQYGPSANGKDAVLGFVNRVDDLVRAHGRTLRIWNDGIGGGSAIAIHAEPVVEWWTDVSPIGDLLAPRPQELLDQGHRILNAGWWPTYYVSGSTEASVPPRPNPADAYAKWKVSDFYGVLFANATLQLPPQRVAADEPRNLGATLHVWNDNPEAETEAQIATGIRPRLRVLAQKTWDSPEFTRDYATFLAAGD